MDMNEFFVMTEEDVGKAGGNEEREKSEKRWKDGFSGGSARVNDVKRAFGQIGLCEGMCLCKMFPPRLRAEKTRK